MIKFKVLPQTKAIGTNPVTKEPIRKTVYYAQGVEINSMSNRALVEAIKNMGSSSFSKGELLGVSTDLGAAIATQLINGYKVTIDGLGTFSPTLRCSESNITDPTNLSKDKLYVECNFKVDDAFTAILETADLQRVSATANVAVGSSAYIMQFKKQESSSNLKFAIYPPEIADHADVNSVVAKVGNDVISAKSLSSGSLFLNDVIGFGDTLTNATVKITMPAVTWTEGEETFEYPAQTFEFTGVTQSASEVPPTIEA